MSAPVSDSASPPKKPEKSKKNNHGRSRGGHNTSSKPRGLPTDSPEVRLSKTLSWILRHGAQKEGLQMRADGYVKVTDLLANPKIKSQGLDLPKLQTIAAADAKQRYSLISESPASELDESFWWIKANQGHSIKEVQLVLTPLSAASDISTGIAVHGTTRKAWASISTQGLSKMRRNHIHLAQGVAGDNIVSGMRSSSQILIFVDVQKAINAGIKFFLSDNGVILTEGDEKGFLGSQFFSKVEDAKRVPLPGWEGP